MPTYAIFYEGTGKLLAVDSNPLAVKGAGIVSKVVPDGSPLPGKAWSESARAFLDAPKVELAPTLPLADLKGKVVLTAEETARVLLALAKHAGLL